MRHPSVARLATLLIGLGAPAALSAQSIMTFLPVACATGGSYSAGDTYSESGFTISSGVTGGLAGWCADADTYSSQAGYAGPGMALAYQGINATLTKNGGGPFSINGIELAHLYSGEYGAQSFTFTGNLYGGGTVSQTFTIGPETAHPLFSPYFFDASFTNLASVVFATQDYAYYQFTNVALDGYQLGTVPEPGSIVLLGSGLVGLGGIVRRRRWSRGG